MGKKGLCLLLVASMTLTLCGCRNLVGATVFAVLIATGDDDADKDEIFELVSDKKEELLKAIEDGDFSAFENHDIIKEIDADEGLVDFYCGGGGLASATFYVGFYYAENDDMTALWCGPPSYSTLTPCGDGYEWRELGGDNRYYTEHICGHFYYYEASF